MSHNRGSATAAYFKQLNYTRFFLCLFMSPWLYMFCSSETQRQVQIQIMIGHLIVTLRTSLHHQQLCVIMRTHVCVDYSLCESEDDLSFLCFICNTEKQILSKTIFSQQPFLFPANLRIQYYTKLSLWGILFIYYTCVSVKGSMKTNWLLIADTYYIF